MFTNGKLTNEEAADLNTHGGLGVLVAAQREGDGVAVTGPLKGSLSIANVRVFAVALADDAILADFQESGADFGRDGGGAPGTLAEISGITAGADGVSLQLPAGVTADIEFSTDLVNWESIATGISDSFDDNDAGRTGGDAGYYRAVRK